MKKKKPVELRTDRGLTAIIPYVTPEMLAEWEVDEGIGVFSQFSSLLRNKDELRNMAALPDGNLAVCLYAGHVVVAYAVRRPAPADDRWGQMDPPILHEIFSETARGWRDQKLMRPTLSMVVDEPANEERILYIVGYSWTWDVDQTGKTLQEYRDTIIHLISPLGFKQYPTNEPNVSLRSENLFMARIGSKVPKEHQKRFTNLLFGIYDDD